MDEIPSLLTVNPTNTSYTSITSGGLIFSAGGDSILSRGVCLSIHRNPEISDIKTFDGTGSGSFKSVISGLTAGTTYFLRAYATNKVGTGYGNQDSITTPIEILNITTTPLSEVTSTSAISGGTITNGGGVVLLSRGVCWSTKTGPTIGNSFTTDGTAVGSFTSTITGLTAGTTYYVRAYATLSSGTVYGNEQIFNSVCPAPTAPGTITGSTSLVQNATGIVYSISSVTDATGYTWTVPAGATIGSGQGTTGITVNFGASGGNISVRAESSCGNSVYTNLAVSTCAVPTAPGTITGNSTVTQNTTGVSYSISAVNGATGYTWTVPDGATIASGQGTTGITVNFGASGGNISVRAESSCGNSVYTNLAVTTCAVPTAPGTITGNVSVTQNTTGVTYSISSVTGATGYTWSVPSGATIASGQGTTGITVNFGSSGGNVGVRAESSCGNSVYTNLAVSTCAVPAAPVTITGNATVTLNATGVTYSISSITDATGYTWTIPSGATIASGQGTTGITVNFGSSGGNIGVRAESSCGNSVYTNLVVSTCAVPTAPGTITGNASVTQNATGVTYSVSAVTGATGYTWTVPSGATIISGQGTTGITVNFGSSGGNIGVRAESSCGNSVYTNLAVSTCAVPAAPVTITGNATVTQNATGVTYSISSITGATGYTWTVPTGATIVSGQGTTGVTVNFGASGGNVSVQATNSCGNSGITSLSVSTCNLPAVPGTITGNATVTQNATGVTYSISSVTGATGYTWTVPSGATIVSGQGTTGITVNFGASGGNVSVQTTSLCGGSGFSNLSVSICSVPAATGFITGISNVPQNATGVTYSISAVAGATNYAWTVPSDATIVSGQGTTGITVNFGTSSGGVTVQASNSCGNSPYTNQQILICSVPTTPGTITGNTSFVPNSTGVTYSILAVSGANGYVWTVPSGATIVSGQGTTSISVNFGTSGGIISVQSTNGCGNSGFSNIPVSPCTVPGSPGTITGNVIVPQNATGVTYSIPAVLGATSYTWSVPPGATITSGQGTTSINVNFGTSGGDIGVLATNSCGDGALDAKAVSTCTMPAAPGTITGNATVAQNATGVTYSISAVSGATGYIWTVPLGATIVSGQGTTSITVNFGTSGGNISVQATNSCGNGASTVKTVTTCTVPAVPGIITGNATVVQNTAGVAYSISAVSGATGYTWTIPSGATIVSGQGTTSITVNFGTSGGNISVQATNSCGNGASTAKTVTTCAVPAAPGAITGNTTVVQNAAGVAYSISAISGATGYTWTIPSGATIVSGQGTTSISVNFGTSGGNISVQATNSCGNGASAVKTVTTCMVPAAPGTITGNATVAQNATGVTFSISAVSGATGYTWSVPTGATIVSGQGTTSISVNFGTSGGNISVLATNSCGNGVSALKTVTTCSVPATPGTITGNTTVAQNATGVTYSISAVSGATGYAWSVPTGATIISGQGTTNITVNFGPTGGSISLSATNTCGSSAINSLNVITILSADCGMVTDIDGNVYTTVTIGTQCWMVENLKTTKFRNGDPIQNVTDGIAWGALTTAAYCWYNNDATNYKATYGALYNWYSVDDSRSIAPVGWHVPTDDEWTTLTTFLGGIVTAGGNLKEAGTSHWISPNTGATNSSGFTALPGSYRDYSSGSYNYLGSYGHWWSSTTVDSIFSWYRFIYNLNANVFRDTANKQAGFAVRCVKD